MSTRCQIGWYENKNDDVSKFQTLMYRHSDGYPGKEDGSEYGVLCELIPFLREWKNKRGLTDYEYGSARLMQCLMNRYDGEMRKLEQGSPIVFSGVLGFGICNCIHGDIDYFYKIHPEGVSVQEVVITDWEKFTQEFKTIREIAI